jgi:nucleoprotein TPR
MQHHPGISSQVPPVSALEKHFLTYFRLAKVVEDSQFNDGAATQTQGVETSAVDAPAAAAGASISIFMYHCRHPTY